MENQISTSFVFDSDEFEETKQNNCNAKLKYFGDVKSIKQNPLIKDKGKTVGVNKMTERVKLFQNDPSSINLMNECELYQQRLSNVIKMQNSEGISKAKLN